MSDNRQLMSINQFIVWSGIGRTRTYEEINSGRLKAFKIGSRTMIRTGDAYAWLEALPRYQAEKFHDAG